MGWRTEGTTWVTEATHLGETSANTDGTHSGSKKNAIALQ